MAASIATPGRTTKDVDVRLLLFESFGGFGKGVGELLWKAANVLQNKLTLMCKVAARVCRQPDPAAQRERSERSARTMCSTLVHGARPFVTLHTPSL